MCMPKLRNVLILLAVAFYVPGASCSKLTMSLVNDSLNFQMAILQLHSYFCWKKNVKILCIAKASHFFAATKITVYLLLKSINVANKLRS